MDMTAAAYLDQLQALLPTGPAWPRDPEATLTRLLAAWGDGMARLDERADNLLAEADPRTTIELLADWERVAGLPDACVVTDQATSQRRTALVAKLTALGGQSPSYFIALAAALGYAITLTEWRPDTTEMDTEYPTHGEEAAFVWQVNAALYSLLEYTSEDDSEMPLAVWGNALLECVISRYKPAHTHVLFAYS